MPTQAPEIGLGRALRKARERQGLTLDDASRGIRLRAEYLDALEREAWDELPGDVYTRSFLRSYATFVRIDPDKAIAVFERAMGRRAAAPAPVERVPAVAASEDEALPDMRRHFPWPMAAAMAVIVLLSAAAIGILSRSASTPEPAEVSPAPNLPVLPKTVDVSMIALRDVEIRVTVDGVLKYEGPLLEDEARQFQGQREVGVWLSTGKLVKMEVNGQRIGKPGEPAEPFERTFLRTDYRGGGGGGSGGDRSSPG